jgi:hypothetical protein
MKTYIQLGKAGEPMRTVEIEHRLYEYRSNVRVKYEGHWYAVREARMLGRFIRVHGETIPVLFSEN